MLLLSRGGRLLVSAVRVRYKQSGEYPPTTEKTKRFLRFCASCHSASGPSLDISLSFTKTARLMAEPKLNELMEKIVSLCKRRGFVFQSSEIYGGINGFW